MGLNVLLALCFIGLLQAGLSFYLVRSVRNCPALKGSLYTGSGGGSNRKKDPRDNIGPPPEDSRKGVQKRDIAAEDDGGGGLVSGAELLEPSYQEDAFGAPVGPLPSVDSKLNWKEVQIKEELAELWIVGAGTMGTQIAKQMVEALGDEADDKVVVAETLSDSRHEELLDIGVLPRLREERTEDDLYCSKNVILCVPPSMAKLNEGGYPEELFDAATLWAGPKGGGLLILVSSTAVYGESDQNKVDETFRVDTRSKRSRIMIDAEEATLSREGTILRLGGLYTEKRGPHTHWLKQAAEGTPIDAESDGILNLLHYEDAAAVAVKLIQLGRRSTVYLASDGNTMTRQEICDAAVASKLFPENEGRPVEFTKMAGYAKGKTVNCKWTQEELGWAPKYPSFNSFMRRLGGEEVADPVREEKKDTSSLLWTPDDGDDEWAI
jgi:nucleoside-diphosphate-sugar epimerase